MRFMSQKPMKLRIRNFLLAASIALPTGMVNGQFTSGAANWLGGTSGDFADAANWSTTNAPVSGGGDADPQLIYPVRINLNSGASGNTLIYSAAQGHTIYTGQSGRVMGASSNAGGSMTITGGIFESRATGSGSDFIGFNGANTGTWSLTIDGGTYTASDSGMSFRLGYTGGTQTAHLNVKNGHFDAGGIRWGWNNSSTGITGTINLEGGTLTTGSFAESNTTAGAISSTINFNGGMLRARSSSASFMTATAVDTANVLSGGAKIDTNGFDITISKALTEDEASPGGGLTKQGNGILTLSGNNTYSGATVVLGGTLRVNGSLNATSEVSTAGIIGGSGAIAGSVTVEAAGGVAPGGAVGTLTIGGNLNLSAMAGGTGKLFYEIGPIGSSDRVDVGGNLNIGSGVLGFSDFDFATVVGFEVGIHTLFSSGSLSGTLNSSDIEGNIGANKASLRISGNQIELVIEETPSATLVIDLGQGTQIPGGAFGTFDALNLPIPPLPTGSILRSLQVDTVLESTDNGNFASDLAVLFDPTPASPGDDFSVIITNGTIKFDASTQLGWPGVANAGPPASLVDTKSETAWLAAGEIDLATTGIFLGNAYNNNVAAPAQGGTWSGTITLTYDLVPTGSAYEVWASTNAPSGGPGDDYDGDGVSNAVEFVLGGSKNTHDLDKLPVSGIDGGNLTFTFIRDQASIDPSIAVVIETGTDLTEWPITYTVGGDTASSSVGVTVVKDTPVALKDRVTLSAPQGADAKKFARLKVTRNP
jgi:autotransporter-associated beta strand protein